MTPTRGCLRWFAVVTAVAAISGACTSDNPGRATVAPSIVGVSGTGTGEVALAALSRTDSCDAVAGRVRSVLLDAVEYVERATSGGFGNAGAGSSGTPEISGLATVQGLAAEDAGVVVAGSNDQEAGVAEGNSTVTDGRFLFTTVQTPTGLELRTVALEDPPRVVGRVALPLVASGAIAGSTLATAASDGIGLSLDSRYPQPPSLLLRNEELVVIGDGTLGSPVTWTTGPTATVMLVDTSDPAAPRVTASTMLEGSVVATRMVDDVPRVVLSTVPEIVVRAGSGVYSDPAGTRAIVESITSDQVLPRRITPDGTVQPLVDCEQVLATPDVTASVDDPNMTVTSPELLSVVNVGATLDDLSTTTVQGGAGLGTTVYASPDAVYLTSGLGSWDLPNSAVHRIELTGDGTRYSGSGSVPGEVLDQYSLSERDGDLRIVTTTTDPVPAPGVTSGPTEILPAPPVTAIPPTEGRLTVLRPGADGVLAEIGHVDDLGVGERVQSVRFVGDLAYVVTFRQVDPLFAIDVSDPTAPRVLGELKIPGFSEYLHPLGDGRLLGIGVDADDRGVTTGAKVSLFDVSDPTRPVETAVLAFPDSASRLGGDPLAFTWDPVRQTASFPMERFGINTQDCTTVGFEYICRPRPDPGGPDGPRRVFVRVVGDRLELAREFAPDANGDRRTDETMTRTVVVDDRIHGVTGSAVWTFDAELRSPEVRTGL